MKKHNIKRVKETVGKKGEEWSVSDTEKQKEWKN